MMPSIIIRSFIHLKKSTKMNRKKDLMFAAILTFAVLLNAGAQSHNRTRDHLDNPEVRNKVETICSELLKAYDCDSAVTLIADMEGDFKTVCISALKNEGGTISDNLSERVVSGCGYTPSVLRATVYLALLEAGATPEDAIDTGDGMYVNTATGDTIKDHSWGHGGYGSFSLERAMAVNSDVALSKAIERYMNYARLLEWMRTVGLRWEGPETVSGYNDLHRLRMKASSMLRFIMKAERGMLPNVKSENMQRMRKAMAAHVMLGIGRKALCPLVPVSGLTYVALRDANGTCERSFIGCFMAGERRYAILSVFWSKAQDRSAIPPCLLVSKTAEALN